MIKPEKQNTLTLVLAGIYILLLAAIVLFKLPFYSPEISDGIRVINLIPLQRSFDNRGVIVYSELRNNILIFIPLGIYLSMLGSKLPLLKRFIVIAGLSLSFEVIQFVFAMGRSDITDILNNTLGGLIGIGIYALLFKALGDKTNKTTNILALAATICVVWRFSHLFYLSHFAMRSLRP